MAAAGNTRNAAAFISRSYTAPSPTSARATLPMPRRTPAPTLTRPRQPQRRDRRFAGHISILAGAFFSSGATSGSTEGARSCPPCSPRRRFMRAPGRKVVPPRFSRRPTTASRRPLDGLGPVHVKRFRQIFAPATVQTTGLFAHPKRRSAAIGQRVKSENVSL